MIVHNIFGWLALSIAHAQEVATDTIATTSSSHIGTSTLGIAEDAVLEVSYTLDGESWHTLGTVTRSSFAQTQMTIPVSSISGWSDLAHLQLRVRSLSSLGVSGVIYVDGMTLQVTYATIPSAASNQNAVVTSGTTTTDKALLPMKAGAPDKGMYVGGDYMHISGARPQAIFEIYRTDDPDTAPNASHVYGATVGDDGTLDVDTATLPIGAFDFVATDAPDHCAGLYIEECRASGEYLGEFSVTISAPAPTPAGL
jgi:hypothetical protein